MKIYNEQIQETQRTDQYDQLKKLNRVDTEKELGNTKTGGMEETGDATVSFSNKSKELSATAQAVNEAPDVRTDKVDRIKQELEAGSYIVDPDKIAEKMINAAG